MKKIFQLITNIFLKSYLQKKQFLNGHSNIIIHRKNYENLKNLNDIEYKVFPKWRGWNYRFFIKQFKY